MSGSTSVGADAFLSNKHCEKTLGPNVSTTRGAGVHINAHPKENRIIYPSGYDTHEMNCRNY
jgi:hypothetical protein